MQKYLILDYETRSKAPLRDVGAAEYAVDESTEIMCAAWRVGTRSSLPHATTKYFSGFTAATHTPDDLLTDLLNPEHKLVAHNAFFEQVITNHVLPRYVGDFDPPGIERWECTAARAAALALPRNLEMACVALKLGIEKDMEGNRLMLKLSKPRKPTKNNPGIWHEDPAELARLLEYCVNDINAEVALFLNTPPLTPFESKVWELDQKINFRGIPVDRHLVAHTIKMIQSEIANVTKEITELSDGAITTVSQRDRIKRFLSNLGVDLPNMQGPTIDAALASGQYTGKALRMLEIKKDFGGTAHSKYYPFWDRSKHDGRIRGSLVYHGASTGRWTSGGVQFHNLPRGTLKNTDLSCKVVKTGDLDLVKVMYGNPMTAFTSNLRGSVHASRGKVLFCADYSAIETRVLFWVADYEHGCELFRQGAKIYEGMAQVIYGVGSLDDVTGDMRQLGKRVMLGCGYGMGAKKFAMTSAEQGQPISAELAKRSVDAYRNTHHPIPKLWSNLEKAAAYAVSHPGKKVKVNHTAWYVRDKFLMCELPSGRCLAYRDPFLDWGTTPWGEKKKTVFFYGLDSISKKWCVQKTYGGLFTENVVQAIARDIMAYNMVGIEAAMYEILLTVHDEIVAERDKGEGSLSEFEKLMATVPPWAPGCPIAVEGWRGRRYKK